MKMYLHFDHEDLHPSVLNAFECFNYPSDEFSFAGLLKCSKDVRGL